MMEGDEDEEQQSEGRGTLGEVLVAQRSYLVACDLGPAATGAFGEDIAGVQFKVAEAPFSLLCCYLRPGGVGLLANTERLRPWLPSSSACRGFSWSFGTGIVSRRLIDYCIIPIIIYIPPIG